MPRHCHVPVPKDDWIPKSAQTGQSQTGQSSASPLVTRAIPDARTEPNPPRALGHAKTYRCRVPPTAIDIFSVPRNPYFNAAHPPSLPKVAADTTPSDLV
ncbi:hypothetical protein DCS_01240 [Drechmeria coniospora]|uniref:Uncharacterized protein n=1 Tax=Drechmeria coniospora TaxID=98403 RepID=A0A151GSL3_DRECN|nr:hypothetical protein DCS_01240 [Drechmeria coniospora]KYK60106.1 hypothetical protein DCS_01240 [Drechmeria coniospora]